MNKQEQLIRKLKAIQALADGGATVGERDAAAKAMTRFMKQHNITQADLESNTINDYWYKWKTEIDKRILFACHERVKGDYGEPESSNYWTNRHKRKQIGFSLTQQQAIDLEVFYEHFKKRLADDLNLFLIAFISKNDLHNNARQSEGKSTLSRDEIKAICRLMDGIQESSPHKQLTTQG